MNKKTPKLEITIELDGDATFPQIREYLLKTLEHPISKKVDYHLDLGFDKMTYQHFRMLQEEDST